MQERYYPEQVEAEARKFWDEHNAFRVTADPDREKFYCLSMFPYPSGRLHMGHVRNYTIGDVISRYQRMRGKNVLQPMGWDAFGLPAENAAIQNNVPAAKWTYENIEYMRDQLKRMGFAYDWERELATCHPEYYRWEQWLLTRLFEKGLMYKRMAEVNWDPVEQTVLANEQVDSEGRGWRSGALVERREIPHWFLKITDYAEELLAELDRLDGWPDEVRKMQRDWIGRSEGLELDFGVEGSEEKLRIYTTRPDTLFGVTFMAVAAAHPLAREAARDDPELAAFIEECRTGRTSEAAMETMEKRGMRIGRNAVNPMNGEAVPIFAANYVLMGYGTGAIMGVPGHDFRDHEFARENGLEIRQVVAPADGSEMDIQAEAYVSYDIVTVNSGKFTGLSFRDAFDRIGEDVEGRRIGERTIRYRLRDWGISRQRYWGCPVPMVHCDSCGEVPVPDEDLPVVLPEDVEHVGHGSPLTRMPEFLDTTCPSCGGKAQRETDTLDTFVESSWYYARFVCPNDDQRMLDDTANYWLPVDQYVGGIEHAVLHLLYARFFHKLLRDAGLVNSDEPFTNLLTQGMVVAETYYREHDGKVTYYAPAEVETVHDAKGKVTGATLKRDGKPVIVGRVEKMSKSKNNGVDPQAMVDKYGADTVRLYMMFTSPPDQKLEWSDSAVEGAFRFLKKLWKLVYQHARDAAPGAPDASSLDGEQRALRRKVHETIAKVSDDVGRRYTFNTAIAATMELVNALAKSGDESEQGRAVMREGLDAVVLMLAPIVPHAAHVLWRALGHETAVIDERWPVADESALERDAIDLVVQVNGKLRGHISVSKSADRKTIESEALENPNVQRFVEGRTIRKLIVVPGKLVNVVV
ncbi:MAG: leucine--tRNA ligase [Gammaproteobacteria bacterium]|nr:leucine--tRNA ligase [Gammaproteobacteria bacterium]